MATTTPIIFGTGGIISGLAQSGTVKTGTTFDLNFINELDTYDVDSVFANTGGDPFNNPDTPLVKTALSKATATGDKPFAKVLKGVLLYGEPFLALLTKYNVIPNANAKYLVNRQYDSTELDRLFSDAKKEEPKRSTILFGLDFGNPIIWLILFIILVLVFSLLTKRDTTQTEKRL